MHTFAQLMPAAADRGTSPRSLWAGRIISGVVAALLTADSLGKLLQARPVLEGTTQLGYPASAVFGLGVTLLSCVVLYVVPRTSILGVVLLTGYLGGAVATHVRVGNPLLTHVLFPTYVAALAWYGVMLRDARVRAFVPWRRS